MTRVEIPAALFHRAQLRAAEGGQTLEQFVIEALQEKLADSRGTARSIEPAWMQGFGKLRRLRKETKRIQARLDDVFEVTDPEDRGLLP